MYSLLTNVFWLEQAERLVRFMFFFSVFRVSLYAHMLIRVWAMTYTVSLRIWMSINALAWFVCLGTPTAVRRQALLLYRIRGHLRSDRVAHTSFWSRQGEAITVSRKWLSQFKAAFTSFYFTRDKEGPWRWKNKESSPSGMRGKCTSQIHSIWFVERFYQSLSICLGCIDDTHRQTQIQTHKHPRIDCMQHIPSSIFLVLNMFSIFRNCVVKPLSPLLIALILYR